jgi:hypothetical protein
MRTFLGVLRQGKIELLEPVPLPDGTKLLVSLVPQDSEETFWRQVSDQSLASVWDNAEDDIYAALLEK